MTLVFLGTCTNATLIGIRMNNDEYHDVWTDLMGCLVVSVIVPGDQV